MKPTLALHKLPLYNTGRLDDADIIAAFAARQGLFDRIITDIGAEKDDSRAQHHLIVGQRGMGKTMLLSRIAAEIRTSLLGQHFIPLSFAEEQYAVDRLSKFWLNCLDSLADAQERAGNQTDAARIDDIVKNLSARLPGASKDDGPLAREALAAFLDAAASLKRRPVLLVDNLQLVFERISGEQQHALRELLMRPGCPILIGASPSPPPDSQDYGAAFYDHFKVHYLRPLEVEEMQALMLHLADAIGREDVRSRIVSHPHRLQVLRQLTGGNPRTTATLFFLYAEDFAPTVFGDLENLLDRVTPLYKARFEELSAQQQVIASAIANHWDPVTSRTLSEVTGLPMTGISGQLDRLEKPGFIERVTLFGQSSTGYQIAERFFNVWFLMRSASRRQRREVEFLTRFIENFYETDDRLRIAKQLLNECNFSPDRHLFTKALAATLDDEAFAADLERHAQLDALRQKAAESRRKLDEILDLSSLPSATLSFNELREQLLSLVPHGAAVTPEHFASAILGDRQMFMSRDRDRLALKKGKLDAESIGRLMDLVESHSHMDVETFGEEVNLFIKQRLAGGQIRSPDDAGDWKRSIQVCDETKKILCLLDTMSDRCAKTLDTESLNKIEPLLSMLEEDEATDLDPALRFSCLLRFERIEGCLAVVRRQVSTMRLMKAGIHRLIEALQSLEVDSPDKFTTSQTQANTLLEHEISLQASLGTLIALIGTIQVELGQIEEAEASFIEATVENPGFCDAWTWLGSLYLFSLNRPDDAVAAYARAAEFGTCTEQGVEELMKFYLDIYMDLDAALKIFERARIQKDEISEDYIHLHSAIFSAYDSNWGIAASALSEALDWQLDDFSIAEQTEWLRASAWFINLNYGAELLSLLEQRGDHTRFRPWYEALKALHLGDRGHLLNIAPEIRTTAEALYDAIKERLDKLPESTRRRPLPKAVKKRGKRR
jgi:hypothetical protein